MGTLDFELLINADHCGLRYSRMKEPVQEITHREKSRLNEKIRLIEISIRKGVLRRYRLMQESQIRQPSV